MKPRPEAVDPMAPTDPLVKPIDPRAQDGTDCPPGEEPCAPPETPEEPYPPLPPLPPEGPPTNPPNPPNDKPLARILARWGQEMKR